MTTQDMTKGTNSAIKPAPKAPRQKLAKGLRRDIRARIKPLVERAHLLAHADPSLRKELATLQLEPLLQQTLGGVEMQQTDERIQGMLGAMPKRSTHGPAPYKHLRRQLKHDFNVVLEEVEMLRHLDPTVNKEVERLGLTTMLERRRQS